MSGRSDLTAPLYDVLGYDASRCRVRIGALAENTHPQIRTMIEEMLYRDRGFTPSEASFIVDEAFEDQPGDMKIKTTGDVGGLFERLRCAGIKIAVCTSDSRAGTTEFLDRERLSGLVNAVLCGDDSHGRPKPDPHNALLLCRELNVRPEDTVMVGDTPADTLMGQQAGLGLTVGVLTGVGSATDLADADVIVGCVHECANLFLDQKPEVAREVHRVTSRGLAKIAQSGIWWLPNGSAAGTARRMSTMAATSCSHVVVGAGSAGCVLANRLTEQRAVD